VAQLVCAVFDIVEKRGQRRQMRGPTALHHVDRAAVRKGDLIEIHPVEGDSHSVTEATSIRALTTTAEDNGWDSRCGCDRAALVAAGLSGAESTTILISGLHE
jgi:hypothetical protein